MMQHRFLLFLSFITFINLSTFAQLTDALYYGEILFSNVPAEVTKKRDMTSLDVFSPEESLFGNLFLKVKMKSHSDFRDEDGKIVASLTIKSESGERTTLTLDLEKELENGKTANFEIVPNVPDMNNGNHLKLAGFLGRLSAEVHSLTFTIGNRSNELIRPHGYIFGKINVDLTSGIGKFQALKDEQDKLDKIAEEERLAKEAEEKRLAEERALLIKKTQDEYFNAGDVVSITFRNTCDHQGTVRIITDNEFTNQRATISGQSQSGSYRCRPGDKIYDSNGTLLHTASSSSNNKSISFCPPKTQEMIDREEFDRGFKSIRVQIRNSCSDTKIYYNHQSGASTSKTSMGSHSQTSLSMRKGDKLWLADSNGNNVTMLFTPISLSQDGQDIYLCR
ncbi:MAG: hypothetical protein AB8B56_15615 [Crocinitomicaceae bacterium]